MTQNILEKTARNNRLILNLNQKISHYGWGLTFIGFSIFLCIRTYYITHVSYSYSGPRTFEEMIKVNLIFGAVGIIFLILKYRNLAFKEIKGSFTQEQVFEAIKRSDMDYNWNLQSRNKFLHRILTREHFITPGKLLTIIHLEDKILFNGIRNPSFSAPRGETFRPSIKEFKVFQKHLNDVVSGMEYVKKKEFNDTQWNWKMILIRLFLYPFCIFLLSFSFFYLIPNKEFVISIPLVAISLVYLFVDLYMIFTSMKNNS